MRVIRTDLRARIFENPLFIHRLAHRSAYRWPNIMLMAIPAAIAIASLLRLRMWLLMQDIVGPVPPDLRTHPFHILPLDLFDHRRGDPDQALLALIQFGGLAALGLWAFLLISRQVWVARQTAARWTSDEIHVSPITQLQATFAYWDWPIVKCMGAAAVATLFCLLPSEEFYLEPGDFRISQIFVAVDQLLWGETIKPLDFGVRFVFYSSALFALHRAVIRWVFLRWRMFDARFNSGWLIAIGLCLYLFRNTGMTTIAWHAGLFVVCGVLLFIAAPLPRDMLARAFKLRAEGLPKRSLFVSATRKPVEARARG